jgi:xanthine dehydrogenase accessory factor
LTALRVLVRGGGDLASGAVIRMHRAGWQVVVCELPQPRAVRRYVSFSEAVYTGEAHIEEVTARRVTDLDGVQAAWRLKILPVIVDPDAEIRHAVEPDVLIDGRMRKLPPDLGLDAAPLVIGLGPGFSAGENCHAVIETIRGHFLGRVIWQGSAQPDTGVPEGVAGMQGERVLRAPVAGILEQAAEIGSLLKAGAVVGSVSGSVITAPFDGVLRGFAYPGLSVSAGEKVGDLDPRGDPRMCWLVSDKALAVGGGVLEAVLSFAPNHERLFSNLRSHDG